MKHVVSFALVLCLLVPFGTGALAAEAGWAVDYYVDDFGDPTDEAYLRGVFSGDFSNTATASSPLTVVVFYDLDYEAFSFRLLEYDNVPATYIGSEAENIVFKIKTADDVISEGTLIGDEPNGDLFLGSGLPVSNRILPALRKGEDVRCIVELGSSKYNFTMNGAGFPDSLAELEEIKYAPAYAAAEELMEAGDYDGAFAAFRALGDYKDSVHRAAEAVEARGEAIEDSNAAAYAEAEALLAGGDNVDAAMAFGALGDYSDAFARSFELWGGITERKTLSSSVFHTVGLHPDGTVTAAGENFTGQCDVSDWTDIAEVAASGLMNGIQDGTVVSQNHTLGLRTDGTVVVAGSNPDGACNVSGWTGIVAVSTNPFYTVGLRADGTVLAVGSNENGRCDVSDWTDIVAVSAGTVHTAGLRSDGTVVAAGDNTYGACDVSDWTDIVAVSVGSGHSVGLRADGTVMAAGRNDYGRCDVSDWTDIVAISAGSHHTVGIKSDGTVVAAGDNEYGQCDVSGWTDIVEVSAGEWHTAGLKADGTVVAVGYSDYGACDVSGWTDIKLPD